MSSINNLQQGMNMVDPNTGNYNSSAIRWLKDSINNSQTLQGLLIIFIGILAIIAIDMRYIYPEKYQEGFWDSQRSIREGIKDRINEQQRHDHLVLTKGTLLWLQTSSAEDIRAHYKQVCNERHTDTQKQATCLQAEVKHAKKQVDTASIIQKRPMLESEEIRKLDRFIRSI